MDILELKIKQEVLVSDRTKVKVARVTALLGELRERSLSDEMIVVLNQSIQKLNSIEGDEKAFRKALAGEESSILQNLEKIDGIVPQNFYLNRWMALGISVFGIPIGAGFGIAMGNMAFIGVGLAIGLSIGMVLGGQKDKDAAKKGKQLNFSLK